MSIEIRDDGFVGGRLVAEVERILFDVLRDVARSRPRASIAAAHLAACHALAARRLHPVSRAIVARRLAVLRGPERVPVTVHVPVVVDAAGGGRALVTIAGVVVMCRKPRIDVMSVDVSAPTFARSAPGAGFASPRRGDTDESLLGRNRLYRGRGGPVSAHGLELELELRRRGGVMPLGAVRRLCGSGDRAIRLVSELERAGVARMSGPDAAGRFHLRLVGWPR